MSDLNPRDATHYCEHDDGRRTHFKIHRNDHHFVWLSIKHGGWAMRSNLPQCELIEVQK